MKKFLSIILAVCVISTLLVMPVSAELAPANYFDYYLRLTADNVISQTVNSQAYATADPKSVAEANPVAYLFDGRSDTVAVLNLLGKATRIDGGSAAAAKDAFLSTDIVIDLGANYYFRGLTLEYPSQAQIDSLMANYEGYVNPQTNAGGVYGTIALYTENPVTNPSAAAVSVTPYARMSVGLDYSAVDPNTQYRYIKINGPWTSRACFISELSVKVSPAETGMKYKHVQYSNSGLPVPQYPMSNAFDGNPDTVAVISGRNSANTQMAQKVIDLGETKKLNGLTIKSPSDWSKLLEDIGVPANFRNGNYGKAYVCAECPTIETYTGNPAGATKIHEGAMGTSKVVTFDEPTDVRYIILEAYMASYPCVISEIEFDEYVAPAPEPIEATFTADVAFGEADGVEALRFYFTPSFTDEITDFGAYIVPFALFEDAGEAVMVNGGKAIESGKTFAADLVGIPAAAYDKTIAAVPFVVSTDNLYTYGTRIQAVVDELK